MRALVVDDDPAIRNFLRRILVKDFGYAVVEAQNGVEALECLDRHSFDVAFVDLHMPIVDGVELLREIRRSKKHDTLAIVVMTAVRDERVVKDIIELGVLDFLAKTGEVDQLRTRLSRLLLSGTARRRAQAVQTDDGARVRRILDGQSSVLVVDRDSDFRHFCMNVFQAKCRVGVADSAAEVLKTRLKSLPDLVLIGTDVGTVSPEFFARKLREADPAGNTMIVASVSKDRVEEARAVGVFDAVVYRSFVPETYMAQFREIFAQPTALVHALNAVPSLRLELISSVEQVIGMMLQAEVALVESAAECAEGSGARVRIELTGLDMALQLTVRTTLARGAGLAQQMLMLETDAVTLDDVTAVLQELANMVGGRIQDKLVGSGVPARMGLPVCDAMGPEPMPRAEEGIGVTLSVAHEGGAVSELVVVLGAAAQLEAAQSAA